MLEYRAFSRGTHNIAELCNGSTADSDSVCWGSNPYSAAKEKRPPSVVFFLSFGNGIEDSHHSSQSERGSHLSESRRGACSPAAKRKILVADEYPYSTRPSSDGLFFFSWLRNRGCTAFPCEGRWRKHSEWRMSSP